MALKYVKLDNSALDGYVYLGENADVTERKMIGNRREEVVVGKKIKLISFEGKKPLVVQLNSKYISLEIGKPVKAEGIYFVATSREINGNTVSQLDIHVEELVSVK